MIHQTTSSLHKLNVQTQVFFSFSPYNQFHLISITMVYKSRVHYQEKKVATEIKKDFYRQNEKICAVSLRIFLFFFRLMVDIVTFISHVHNIHLKYPPMGLDWILFGFFSLSFFAHSITFLEIQKKIFNIFCIVTGRKRECAIEAHSSNSN